MPENNQIITAPLPEVLRYRAQSQSNRQAYIFLQNGETESASAAWLK